MKFKCKCGSKFYRIIKTVNSMPMTKPPSTCKIYDDCIVKWEAICMGGECNMSWMASGCSELEKLMKGDRVLNNP